MIAKAITFFNYQRMHFNWVKELLGYVPNALEHWDLDWKRMCLLKKSADTLTIFQNSNQSF